MRFSREGFYGQGIYFANTARYSHDYAFKTPQGQTQLFLVFVLAGDSVKL